MKNNETTVNKAISTCSATVKIEPKPIFSACKATVIAIFIKLRRKSVDHVPSAQ